MFRFKGLYIGFIQFKEFKRFKKRILKSQFSILNYFCP